MPSLCVLTSYSADFRDIGDFAALGAKTYAAVFRVEYYVESNQPAFERPAPWYRVKLISDIFKTGVEFVLWIDADATFVRYDADIRDLIIDDKDLYMVEHSVSIGGKMMKIPNTGVMLLRNCEWSKNLLNAQWEKEQYIHHGWWDNAAMLNLFGYNEVMNEGDDKFNLDILNRVQFLPLEWNSVPNVCISPTPIITHYAGVPRDVRMRELPRDCLTGCMSAIAGLYRDKRESLAGKRN